MLHVSDLAGLVLEIVDLSGTALFDHLLPSTREQLAEIFPERFVPDWILDGTPRNGSPSGRDGARGMDVRI